MTTWKLRFVSLLALLILSAACAPRTAPATTAADATAEPPSAAAPAEGAPPKHAAAAEILALDPDVRAGTLDNGLRYFVRVNSEPKERAELWLAINSGSLQEDEDQRGLAHFVEHMAFNGTENFAKQEIIDYLESIGMRFGADLNAYTSFDETVYTLTVPTDEPATVEKGFLILKDWAQGISFEDEEIDKERGVVVEEWRSGRGAQSRIRDKQLPVLFQGSRYAERLPIGKTEILENAPYEALKSYYADWYRPDLMGVIAVGDFDPDRIETLIRESFSGLKGPANPREREIYPVPDHEETLVAIATDPELTTTRAAVYNKIPKRPDGSAADYRRLLQEQLYHGMINNRLRELTEKAEPPFLFAFSSSGQFVRSKDVFFQIAAVQEGGLEIGMDALLTEVERVARFGFTASELERAKANTLRGFEQAYRERDKRKNGQLAGELLRHYLVEEEAPGIEIELELAQRFIPTITLSELNGLADEWVTEDNRVITVSGPDKPELKMPNESELLAMFGAVQQKELEPFVDLVREEPLLAATPAPGTIVEKTRVEELDVTVWRLSNGVRVVLKPTDFKNDEILLGGFSPGGTSLVPDPQHTSATNATSIVAAGGLGNFNRIELGKALTGKLAGARVFIGELSEGVSASASPEDLETMFQLLYLNFTAPREDLEAFASWMSKRRAGVENRLARPETVFSDKMRSTLSQDHPRRRPTSDELLDEIDLPVAFAVYRDRFADAGDFTFVIVGNFDPAGIRDSVLSYLGGLPALGREETWHDVGVTAPPGVVRFEIHKGLEPKSRVQIRFHGDAEYSRQEQHDLQSLASVLAIRLREVLREDMGATYGVGVNGSISRRPRERYGFSVNFGCAPENVDAMIEAVFDEIEAIQRDGIDSSYIEKVQETQRRGHEVSMRENRYWLGSLRSSYDHSTDPLLILEYDQLVDSISPDRMQAAAKRYLDAERYVQGVLYPEEAPEE